MMRKETFSKARTGVILIASGAGLAEFRPDKGRSPKVLTVVVPKTQMDFDLQQLKRCLVAHAPVVFLLQEALLRDIRSLMELIARVEKELGQERVFVIAVNDHVSSDTMVRRWGRQHRDHLGVGMDGYRKLFGNNGAGVMGTKR